MIVIMIMKMRRRRKQIQEASTLDSIKFAQQRDHFLVAQHKQFSHLTQNSGICNPSYPHKSAQRNAILDKKGQRSPSSVPHSQYHTSDAYLHPVGLKQPLTHSRHSRNITKQHRKNIQQDNHSQSDRTANTNFTESRSYL